MAFEISFDWLFGKTEQPTAKKVEVIEEKAVAQPNAFAGGGGVYRTMFTHSYDGEKNLGELGPVRDYGIDYQVLRVRSWQSYLESEITQTVVRRFVTWIIGKGMKLQAEPSTVVLESEKIKIDQSFNEITEALFGLFAKSKRSDYANMRSFNHIMKRAKINAILGGDVLMVLRVANGNVTVQLIDGCHIQSPRSGSEYWPEVLINGNMIKYGVEVTPTGEHVAYHVRQADRTFVRIPARGDSSGLLMAVLYTGTEYRLDSVRGMPLIAVVLETMAKLERYKEAAVGSAEERQKIPYFFEHEMHSTGENPLLKQAAMASGFGKAGDIPVDQLGNELANKVAATTNKQVFNMPIGAKIKAVEGKNEMFFKDFYTTNIEIICAAINIPPNVAMSKYDSNFSASRAALKDWEHTLLVEREDMSEQILFPVYELFLDVNILKNKIQAPGYLSARLKNNYNVLEAYRLCRFVGPAVPHIDPEKEVRAERLKLGTTGESIPLTTVEAAVERLNSGESDENMKQYAEELKMAKELGIYLEVSQVTGGDQPVD